MKKLSTFPVIDLTLIKTVESEFFYGQSPELYFKALGSLKKEIQTGWDSVTDKSGWVSEEETYRILGITR